MSWTSQTALQAAQHLRAATLDRTERPSRPIPADIAPVQYTKSVLAGLIGALLLGLGIYLSVTPSPSPLLVQTRAFAAMASMGMALFPIVYIVFALRKDPTGADIRSLIAQDQLAWLGGTAVPHLALGHLPYFDTEERETPNQYSAELLLGGSYHEHPVALVEFHQVINTWATTEIARKTHLGGKNQLRLRSVDAVVRAHPQQAPELFVVPWNDPSLDHYRRLLQRVPESTVREVSSPADLAQRFWIVSSHPAWAQSLLEGDCGALLRELDWAILQVLDGHACFLGSRRVLGSGATRLSGELRETLDDAARFFDAVADQETSR